MQAVKNIFINIKQNPLYIAISIGVVLIIIFVVLLSNKDTFVGPDYSEFALEIGLARDEGSISFAGINGDDPERKGLEYKLIMYSDQKKLVKDVAKGNINIASVSSTVAAKYYAKDPSFKVVTLSSLNPYTLYFNNSMGKEVPSESGDDKSYMLDFENLQGAKICSNGKGEEEQYVLDSLKTKLGKDFDVDYIKSPLKCISKLENGEVKFALLKDIFGAHFGQNDDISAQGISSTGIIVPEDVVIVNTEWLNTNQALFQDFIKVYSQKIDNYSNELIYAYNMINIEFEYEVITGQHYIKPVETKNTLQEFYNDLIENKSKLIGDTAPDDDFYYYFDSDKITKPNAKSSQTDINQYLIDKYGYLPE
ncbi:MAG: hypothetical protein LBN03_02530 [Bifidobacteriaceae bacterium]|jgi:hypothetical protein|nr:hypothetical protein [Bifidobacteriaceae bacterium]